MSSSLYLKHFSFPTRGEEESYRWGISQTCFDTIYPFFILSKHGLEMIDFEPITIFYGGNGSGKTTALNVIAEKIKANRDALYNRNNFYEDYLRYCKYEMTFEKYENARIITSDDVFDFMLTLRAYNEDVDDAREEVMDEYFSVKHSNFKLRSIEDIDMLRKVNLARKKSQSQYVRKTIADNGREHSNGESAYIYFTNKINENGIYLLDEPENSLSPERQLELVKFITDCSRFFNCQFIIATHSPFLLSLKGAKIYDFDEDPVDVKRWTELGNVRAYYDFFKEHEREFNSPLNYTKKVDKLCEIKVPDRKANPKMRKVEFEVSRVIMHGQLEGWVTEEGLHRFGTPTRILTKEKGMYAVRLFFEDLYPKIKDLKDQEEIIRITKELAEEWNIDTTGM